MGRGTLGQKLTKIKKNAFYALRESARKNGLQDMPLEEINEEIRLAIIK